MTDFSSLLHIFGIAAASLALAVTAVWLLSVRLGDVSIVDVFWGLGFVGVAWLYRVLGPEPAAPRQLLLLALVTVWGVRLAAYIYWRSRGKEEDRRYAAMRRRHGTSFRWKSLFTVFWLQGALVAVISWPLLVTEASVVSRTWRWSDTAGLVFWLIGFVFEAGGDYQMARFKADPANRGKVLDRGFWAYTRHPNYFGDAMMWWGYYLFALGAPGGAWTVFAPVLMTFFLLKVSGVSLLESDIAERRPAYRDYIESTNAFLPGPRRRQEGKGTT